MFRKSVVASSFALALGSMGLVSCGDDGGSPPITGGTPTPSPTYTKLAELSGNWSYPGHGCHKPGSQFKILGLSNPSDGTMQIDYDAGQDQFSIRGDGFDKTFGTADLERSTSNFRRYSRFTGSGFESLSVTLPVANSDLTRVAEYSGFFEFGAANSAGVSQSYGCPFGEQTRQGDLPRSNTSYQTLSIGGFSTIPGGGGFLINRSTIAVNYSSSAKTVSVDLNVIVFDRSRREVSVGKYGGTFSVDQTTGRFTGRPTGTGLVSTEAEISGVMFGPQGKDMIVTFAFNTQLTTDYYTQIYGESFLTSP